MDEETFDKLGNAEKLDVLHRQVRQVEETLRFIIEKLNRMTSVS